MSNQDAIKSFINTFFEKKSKYYILKDGAVLEELNEELNTILKKNPKIQIPLKINPKILELCQSSIQAYQANEVLDEYLKKYFSNNKNKKNNFSDLYDAVFMLIRSKIIIPQNNNSAVEKLLNKKLDDLIRNYGRITRSKHENSDVKKLLNEDRDKLFAKYVGTTDIKVLQKKLIQQIRVIYFAIECGFTTWEQLINMLIFLRKIYEKKIQDKFDFKLSNTNQSNDNSDGSNSGSNSRSYLNAMYPETPSNSSNSKNLRYHSGHHPFLNGIHSTNNIGGLNSNNSDFKNVGINFLKGITYNSDNNKSKKPSRSVVMLPPPRKLFSPPRKPRKKVFSTEKQNE
jgi:hypothetical protein